MVSNCAGDFEHLKPTYEGLKAVPRRLSNIEQGDLKPTYEGLKEGRMMTRPSSIRDLKPTYEGLKAEAL